MKVTLRVRAEVVYGTGPVLYQDMEAFSMKLIQMATEVENDNRK